MLLNFELHTLFLMPGIGLILQAAMLIIPPLSYCGRHSERLRLPQTFQGAFR